MNPLKRMWSSLPTGVVAGPRWVGHSVANVTGDPSETCVVQVTADHDAGVLLGIRQDRLQLVATRRRRQARHGAQME